MSAIRFARGGSTGGALKVVPGWGVDAPRRGLGPALDRSTPDIDSAAPRRTGPIPRLWTGLVLGAILSLFLAQGVFGLLQAADASTWEVYDSDGDYAGLLVAKREEGQDWEWTYYEQNSEPPPQHVEAGTGTAQGGPKQYTWTASSGDTGTVEVVDGDPDKAEWTNETAGTRGTLRRLP